MSGSDDVHCGTDKRLAMPTSNNALDTPPAEKSEKSDCDGDDAKNTPLSEFDENDVEALNSDSDHVGGSLASYECSKFSADRITVL
jgi:hypothetical protein